MKEEEEEGTGGIKWAKERVMEERNRKRKSLMLHCIWLEEWKRRRCATLKIYNVEKRCRAPFIEY